MKRFVQSGGAFMVVALLCFASAIISDNWTISGSVGGFWVVMAIVVRGKYKKEKSSGDKS